MKQIDYLIIGQGLAGTMLAFEMLDRGMNFKILSSEELNTASKVAAGMINPLVYRRLTKSWMVDTLLPHLQNRYRFLEKLLNTQFFYQKNILKPLSDQEKELWKKKMSNPGFSSYIKSVLDESPIEGIAELPGYGIVENAGYLNLSVFLETASDYFKSRGLLYHETIVPEKCKDSEFELGKSKAKQLIFCDGYHLTKNPLFQFIYMKPAKGEVVLIHAPALPENYIINKRVFVLPVGNHHFKVGSTYEWEDLSENTTLKGKTSILERLNELININYEVVDHWAGIRPTISDRRPVLGQHPDFKHLFVFNGLGTKGVMLAPYLAREMCNFLGSEDYELPQEISLTRFI